MKIDKTLAQAIKHWDFVAPLIRYPSSSEDCDQLIHQLDQLLEIVGQNETHPLSGLVEVLSNLIEDYEEKKYKNKLGVGIEALQYLMDLHELTQSDLPEIGSQGVVSELLNGKRQLNIRQVKLLAKRFKVDPSTFIN